MRTILKLSAVLTLAAALTGCGTLGFGDGQIDLLTLAGIVTSAQAGDVGLLCETVLAGQSKASAAEAGLLQAACRGLLGQLAPQSSATAAPSVVAGSAVPAAGACEELRVAFDLAANACGW